MFVSRCSIASLAALLAPVLPSSGQPPQQPVLYVLGTESTTGQRVIERRSASGVALGSVTQPGVLSTFGPQKFGVGPDGLVYVSGVTTGPGTWRFDPLSGKSLGLVTLAAGYDIALNANGTRMFLLTSGVTTVDVATGAVLGTSGYAAVSIARGPDGSIFTASNDLSGAYIDQYDAQSGQFLQSVVWVPIPITHHSTKFLDLDFEPNGEMYAAFALDTFAPMLTRYSTQSWTPLATAPLVVYQLALAAPNLVIRPSLQLFPDAHVDAYKVPAGALHATWTLNGINAIEEIEVEVDADCNANGVVDSQDIASGASTDCNRNGRPDECEIAFGSSLDLDGNLVPDECAELASSVASASISSQGAQPLALSSGPVHAGNVYLLLGSSSGTTPPLALDGLKLPLVPDAYFAFTLANPNQPPLAGSLGVLDAAGAAQATVQVPAGASATLAGLQLWHAFAVLALAPAPHAVATSNAVALVLVP